ncbi:MAG: SDR family oxidoreductase [Bacteroidales bacterium]|nr:SDR family oxidoreductase [Bacteroidales bacterium]
MKKILVTGSEGYIGTIMVPILIKNGYDVTGCDPGFFAEGNLTQTKLPEYKLIKKDMRDLKEEELVGFDSIINLAALCNDPLGDLLEDLTYEINYIAAVNLARFARNAGVNRFIYSSSCSLYGQGTNKVLTEDDPPNPQTAYGKSKILAEKEIAKLADNSFSPVFMRNATAFGISPRMRFNIVANNLAGYAKTTRKIQILGDGTPWRPLVHIKDISEAFLAVLEAERGIIHNHTFNIGSSNENYQIIEIARKVKQHYPDCEITIAQKRSPDTRNYSVSFDKLNNRLGFAAKITLETGLKEIAKIFDSINLTDKLFKHRLYSRLLQMKYLIENGFLHSDLRWKS